MTGTFNPDDLLGVPVVNAAVEALATRNKERLLTLEPGERDALVAEWRGVALDVLTAARAAVAGGPEPQEADGRGRAVIVIEDDGDRRLDVHAAFFPELDEAGEDLYGTAAQAAAVEVLKLIAGAEVGAPTATA